MKRFFSWLFAGLLAVILFPAKTIWSWIANPMKRLARFLAPYVAVGLACFVAGIYADQHYGEAAKLAYWQARSQVASLVSPGQYAPVPAVQNETTGTLAEWGKPGDSPIQDSAPKATPTPRSAKASHTAKPKPALPHIAADSSLKSLPSSVPAEGRDWRAGKRLVFRSKP